MDFVLLQRRSRVPRHWKAPWRGVTWALVLRSSVLGLCLGPCLWPGHAWGQSNEGDTPATQAPDPERATGAPPQAAPAQAPSTGEPAPTGAPAPAPAPAQSRAQGDVTLVLFDVDSKPHVGLRVDLVGGGSGVTNLDGTVRLRGPAGKTRLVIELSFAGEGRTLEEPLEVFPGETVQLLLTVAADGSVKERDLEAPDAATVAAAQEASKQAAGPPGLLQGTVTSQADGSPVVGAKVFVLGSPVEAETDMQGKFSLEVPSGVHAVSIIHPRFSTHVERDVSISAQRPAVLTIGLEVASIELDDFVVTVPRIEGSVARVLEQRRESVAVTDALGAEDLAKSPDGSASAATRRIVGATIVDGKYLVVRGLRGRYTNVRLNGVPLPSTDPDVPGVQLDLFPSNLLENLTIAKTFTADIPADFAGGSMNIVTKAYPEELRARVSLGTSFNTQTTFQKISSYPGGGTDWLGLDDGTRALPAAVPDQKLERGTRSKPGYSRDEINEIARSFASNWEVQPKTAPPDVSLSGSVGNTFEVGGRPLGAMLTLTYKNEWQRGTTQLGKVRLEGQDVKEVKLKEQLTEEWGRHEATIGGLANMGFSPADGHDLRWIGFITQTGQDDASRVYGLSEEEGTDIEWNLLNYASRRLIFNQFLGQHREFLGELEADWQFNFDFADRDQPDGRSMLYTQGPQGPSYRDVTGSAERLFTDLSQKDMGGGFDLRHPLFDGKAAAGFMTRYGDRTFVARRFGHSFVGTPEQRLLPPNELFAPDNQGVTVELDERTRPTDGYLSSDAWHAGYLSLDQQLTDWLKANAGLRMEAYNQSIQVEAPFSGADDSEWENVERQDMDLMGAGSLMFLLSDEMSVRAAYGGTVGRPLARELAPFTTQDFKRRRTVRGNPDLQRTYIHNLDARWELFPSSTEVLAASGFYKVFQAPIETVIEDDNGNITFENAESAQNFGVELEARASLSRLTDALDGFTVLGNVSLIYSQVTLSEAQAVKATNAQRALAGQSPWVVNASLGYEPEGSRFRAFIFYNVFGPRILEVGSLGLPDVVEQPFHGLDVTAFYDLGEHWTLNLSAKNLVLQSVRVTQAQYVFAEFEPGTEVSLKITWQND